MAATQPTIEGTASFSYQSETFQTYYRVYGDLATRTRTPLVVLHGGPGMIHDYLLPISDLAADDSIPVIFYDQLGNGRSTHLKDKPQTFWTIDLFIDELINLLVHLGITDSFDMLGHSWGGILAAEFEVRRQPAGLRRLVLSNSLASIALRQESNVQLLATFPKEVQEGLLVGMADRVAFHAAFTAFIDVHGCMVKPMPKEVVYTLEQTLGESGDPTVANAPVVKDWTIIDRLHTVRVPTLVLNGRFDFEQDFVVAPLFEKIPKAKWITFEKSSHMPFWEERERYMRFVEGYLRWDL